VTPVTTDAAFFAMQGEWNDLLQQTPHPSVFATWEWVFAWWTAYHEKKHLSILRVTQDGQTVGLAPFFRGVTSRYRFLPLRLVSLLGDGSHDSDYLDFISKSGHEHAVARCVADFLLGASNEWDAILLNEIPDTSPHLAVFGHLFPEDAFYYEETAVPCAEVTLPSDWNAYLGRLKPRMRSKIRSLTSHLTQSFAVVFDRCERAEELSPRLASLFDLHQRRWQLEGQEGVFASPAKRLFYHEMSSRFLARGWLAFYSLAVDGQPVAHQLCLEYGNRMYLLQEGYDPAWTNHGVGNVLRAYVFRDCIGRGLAAYDFLGGVTPHKLSWGSTVKMSRRIAIGPRTLTNRIVFEGPRALAWGKDKAKRILPDRLLRWGRSVLGPSNR
jgi:CelD/BcsL family acetyltransferase involved in cellulose biosynthesis